MTPFILYTCDEYIQTVNAYIVTE